MTGSHDITTAIVLTRPRDIDLRDMPLIPVSENDVVVRVLWSAISTGTEKLLFEGAMPEFPGMGYPLVPGYESVGRVEKAPANTGFSVGDFVFVPGAQCFATARGLFGASASRLIVPAARLIPIPEVLGENAVLLALAATAHHALMLNERALPDLIIGHGIVGRLLARLTLALGGSSPVVWENKAQRRNGGGDYAVIDGATDTRRDYALIVDASGDPGILDTAVAHMRKRGEITLAGFYATPLALNFAPAFMREASFRIAAEFEPSDVHAVLDLIADGNLSLDGLITHRQRAEDMPRHYATAFNDPECLKMIIDWEARA